MVFAGLGAPRLSDPSYHLLPGTFLGLVKDLLFLFACFCDSCFNNKSKHQNINHNLEETKNTPNVEKGKNEAPNKC